MHLVGFIIRIYHDARSPERHILIWAEVIWVWRVLQGPRTRKALGAITGENGGWRKPQILILNLFHSRSGCMNSDVVTLQTQARWQKKNGILFKFLAEADTEAYRHTFKNFIQSFLFYFERYSYVSGCVFTSYLANYGSNVLKYT